MNSYPFTLVVLSLLVGQLVLAPSVMAAPYPYGQDIIRFGHNELDSAPLFTAEPQTHDAAQPSTEADFLRQVEAMEQEYGPYAAGLSESLYDLGRFYQSGAEADRALAAFRRALHVIRINDGLNSDRQIPLLRATLDTYRMSGDFEGLDDKYSYYFNLLNADQPPHTELRLNAALAYLRWQREALRLGIDRRQDRRLSNLLRLNSSFLDMVYEDETLVGRWFAPFVLSQVKNFYLLQDRVEPPIEIRGSSRTSLGVPTSSIDEDPVRSSLQRRRSGAPSVGSALLREALLYLPETAPVEDRARLQLALADWHVWNDGVLRGGRYYDDVIDTLKNAGRNDLLHQWLGEPVELPDNGVYFQPALDSAINESASIAMQFDVSETGRASNIVLPQQLQPELETAASRIARRLRAVQFRPRWQSGFAQPVAQVQRSYVWLD